MDAVICCFIASGLPFVWLHMLLIQGSPHFSLHACRCKCKSTSISVCILQYECGGGGEQKNMLLSACALYNTCVHSLGFHYILLMLCMKIPLCPGRLVNKWTEEYLPELWSTQACTSLQAAPVFCSLNTWVTEKLRLLRHFFCQFEQWSKKPQPINISTPFLVLV